MEYVGKQNIKKLCNFYVSDLHLSVMLLPYLSKQLNEDVEITTIFEKLKKENIETILDKLNVKNKEEILNIKWFNNSEDTDDKIEKMLNENDSKKHEHIIIVGGSQKFIENNNKIISKMLDDNNITKELKIINCFDLEDVGGNMKTIIKNYDGILNTAGETAIATVIFT